MKLDQKDIKKAIIFRALQLGDMLCSIPAIRALRHAYPEAEITLTGLPWAKSLLDRFPDYFDRFIPFPGYPGLPEQPFEPKAVLSFLKQMQENKYDLALQMQGNGSVVNPLVMLFAAKHTAGFCTPNDYAPDNGLFIEYPDYTSEIERHLKLMGYLRIPARGLHLEFPLTSKDQKEFNRLELPVEPGQYICIHPGSRGEWRQWPTAHFASLADQCIGNGLQAVITGTQEEMHIVSDVVSQMKSVPVIAAGKTSLGTAGILIKNAYALISNCTGVSHMAAAFQTPSIVISMDGEPGRWAPLNKDIHQVIDWTINKDFGLVQYWLNELLKNRPRSVKPEK